jgi:hypothetical protein
VDDGTLTSDGTVTALEKPDHAAEVLEAREASFAKGELRLVVAYGEEAVEIRLPEPKAKPGK